MNAQRGIVAAVDRLIVWAPAGFAMGFHIRLITPSFMFQTYPRSWNDIYVRKGLLMRDPTVLWGFDNTGVALWSDLADLDTENVMGQAAEHGICHGFTYATDAGDSRSITSFARSDRPFAEDEILGIRTEVDLIHDLTGGLSTLDGETRGALVQRGVTFTHP